jgi:hypothetical protein
MLVNFMGLMNAINGSYNSASVMFGSNEARLGLASRVHGNMTPGEVRDVFVKDKALELKNAQAKVLFAAYQAQQEEQKKRLKEYFELQKRLNDAWFA